MTNEKISNSIIQAIDIITTKKLEEAKFDKTISATIIKIVDATSGKYLALYQDAEIEAYSSNTTIVYKEGDNVYITVPQNDMNKEKTIIGKVGSDVVEKNVFISNDQSFKQIGLDYSESTAEQFVTSLSKANALLLYAVPTGNKDSSDDDFAITIKIEDVSNSFKFTIDDILGNPQGLTENDLQFKAFVQDFSSLTGIEKITTIDYDSNIYSNVTLKAGIYNVETEEEQEEAASATLVINPSDASFRTDSPTITITPKLGDETVAGYFYKKIAYANTSQEWESLNENPVETLTLNSSEYLADVTYLKVEIAKDNKTHIIEQEIRQYNAPRQVIVKKQANEETPTFECSVIGNKSAELKYYWTIKSASGDIETVNANTATFALSDYLARIGEYEIICSVVEGQKFIGFDSYQYYNEQVAIAPNYTLKITNANQVFEYYRETKKLYTLPENILPLSVELISPTGTKIDLQDENIVVNWNYDVNKSLIKERIINENDAIAFYFSLQDIYDINKTQGQVQAQIIYDDQVFTASTTFNFILKELLLFDDFPTDEELKGLPIGSYFTVRRYQDVWYKVNPEDEKPTVAEVEQIYTTYKVLEGWKPNAQGVLYEEEEINGEKKSVATKYIVSMDQHYGEIDVTSYGILPSRANKLKAELLKDAKENSDKMKILLDNIQTGSTIIFPAGHFFFSQPINLRENQVSIRGAAEDSYLNNAKIGATYLHFINLSAEDYDSTITENTEKPLNLPAALTITHGSLSNLVIMGDPEQYNFTIDRDDGDSFDPNNIKLYETINGESTVEDIYGNVEEYSSGIAKFCGVYTRGRVNIRNVSFSNFYCGCVTKASNVYINNVSVYSCHYGFAVGADARLTGVFGFDIQKLIRITAGAVSVVNARGDSVGKHLIEFSSHSQNIYLQDIGADFCMKAIISIGTDDGVSCSVSDIVINGISGRASVNETYHQEDTPITARKLEKNNDNNTVSNLGIVTIKPNAKFVNAIITTHYCAEVNPSDKSTNYYTPFVLITSVGGGGNNPTVSNVRFFTTVFPELNEDEEDESKNYDYEDWIKDRVCCLSKADVIIDTSLGIAKYIRGEQDESINLPTSGGSSGSGGTVNSVNGIKPDDTGNVIISNARPATKIISSSKNLPMLNDSNNPVSPDATYSIDNYLWEQRTGGAGGTLVGNLRPTAVNPVTEIGVLDGVGYKKDIIYDLSTNKHEFFPRLSGLWDYSTGIMTINDLPATVTVDNEDDSLYLYISQLAFNPSSGDPIFTIFNETKTVSASLIPAHIFENIDGYWCLKSTEGKLPLMAEEGFEKMTIRNELRLTLNKDAGRDYSGIYWLKEIKIPIVVHKTREDYDEPLWPLTQVFNGERRYRKMFFFIKGKDLSSGITSIDSTFSPNDLIVFLGQYKETTINEDTTITAWDQAKTVASEGSKYWANTGDLYKAEVLMVPKLEDYRQRIRTLERADKIFMVLGDSISAEPKNTFGSGDYASNITVPNWIKYFAEKTNWQLTANYSNNITASESTDEESGDTITVYSRGRTYFSDKIKDTNAGDSLEDQVKRVKISIDNFEHDTPDVIIITMGNDYELGAVGLNQAIQDAYFDKNNNNTFIDISQTEDIPIDDEGNKITVLNTSQITATDAADKDAYRWCLEMLQNMYPNAIICWCAPVSRSGNDAMTPEGISRYEAMDAVINSTNWLKTATEYTGQEIIELTHSGVNGASGADAYDEASAKKMGYYIASKVLPLL